MRPSSYISMKGFYNAHSAKNKAGITVQIGQPLYFPVTGIDKTDSAMNNLIVQGLYRSTPNVISHRHTLLLIIIM